MPGSWRRRRCVSSDVGHSITCFIELISDRGSINTYGRGVIIFNVVKCHGARAKCEGPSPRRWCIEESWLCNGVNDCGDNWDEDPANCGPCEPTTWTEYRDRIVNGGRRRPSLRTLSSCQAECVKDPQCTRIDWRGLALTSNKCWHHSRWSAGNDRIPQPGIDHYQLTRHAYCPVRRDCPSGKLKCEGQSPIRQCIKEGWLCDGTDDCGNNWDEDPANCRL